jgi:hypothetical protein
VVALWWPEAAVYRESVKNGNVTKVTFWNSTQRTSTNREGNGKWRKEKGKKKTGTARPGTKCPDETMKE